MKPEMWMERAVFLAGKGRLTTSPNPMVGACVVRNNKKVGEGYHRRYGGNHAEVEALRAAGRRARGAVLYVTLEPCATWGKTPPCVAAILDTGIREVVIGTLDPNPKNHGKGVAALRRAGVKVTAGVLEEEIRKLNAAFFKYVRTGLPFVTLKMAQSLDGKIALASGESRWISSPPARCFVHRLRAEQDALLIGKNTLMRDNPRLSPRFNIRGNQPGKPWRVVLDPPLPLSSSARIFEGPQVTLLVVPRKHLKKMKSKESRFLLPVEEKKGALDLEDLLRRLASLGVAKLLVEGGGELAWSFLAAGKVDKAYWIVAPKILGGRRSKTSVEGEGVSRLSQFLPAPITQVRPLGPDWLFETSGVI